MFLLSGIILIFKNDRLVQTCIELSWQFFIQFFELFDFLGHELIGLSCHIDLFFFFFLFHTILN